MMRPPVQGLVALRCVVLASLAIGDGRLGPIFWTSEFSCRLRRPRLLKEAAMKLKAVILTSVAVSLFALPALAHHSFAMFDQNKLNTMTGTVKQFEWQNPHAWLQIEIADANGKAAIWSFEGGSPAQLATLGWKPESFHVGDKVEVGFRPLKDGSRGGQLMSVKFASGQRLCSNRGCGDGTGQMLNN
jgi:hypothetical protein